MYMRVLSVALLVIHSASLYADSTQNEYATQVARSMLPAVVDMKIDAFCVKQVTPSGQTIVENDRECGEALNRLEASLGETEDEATVKLNIKKFRQHYSLF